MRNSCDEMTLQSSSLYQFMSQSYQWLILACCLLIKNAMCILQFLVVLLRASSGVDEGKHFRNLKGQEGCSKNRRNCRKQFHHATPPICWHPQRQNIHKMRSPTANVQKPKSQN